MLPPYLKIGDTVALVATAKKVSPEVVEQALTIFQQWGLKVVVGENALNTWGWFAGTDEERTTDIQSMFTRSDIQAIVCLRGGYGTSRMMDNLDFTPLLQAPKWLVGFSDITVLHSKLSHYNLASIHGTMPILFDEVNDKRSTDTLKEALFGTLKGYSFDPHSFNRFGKVTAPLVGGNLALLHAITGTNYDVDTQGKILFIEDIDEYAYSIDRMMIHLKSANKLAPLAGMLVGYMTNIKESEEKFFGKTAYQIIQEVVSPYSFPVAFAFPAGHEPNNCALYFNKNATLTIEENFCGLNF